MTLPKFIDIDGKRFLWRDIVALRQEQCRAAALAAPVQPPSRRRTHRRRPLFLAIPVFRIRHLSRKGAGAGRLPSSFTPAPSQPKEFEP
jgi:hypothetical protein